MTLSIECIYVILNFPDTSCNAGASQSAVFYHLKFTKIGIYLVLFTLILVCSYFQSFVIIRILFHRLSATTFRLTTWGTDKLQYSQYTLHINEKEHSWGWTVACVSPLSVLNCQQDQTDDISCQNIALTLTFTLLVLHEIPPDISPLSGNGQYACLMPSLTRATYWKAWHFPHGETRNPYIYSGKI